MKRSELTEFSVEEEGFKLKIKRGENGVPIVTSGRTSTPPFPPPATAESTTANSAPPMPAPAAATPAPAAILAPSASGANGVDEPGVTYIKSPMVGTFYRSSSPENSAFVDPGAAVSEKTVVCIIEAMKIMNEIQAEAKGTVVETLVENGQPVEYGQRLFKLKAA